MNFRYQTQVAARQFGLLAFAFAVLIMVSSEQAIAQFRALDSTPQEQAAVPATPTLQAEISPPSEGLVQGDSELKLEASGKSATENPAADRTEGKAGGDAASEPASDQARAQIAKLLEAVQAQLQTLTNDNSVAEPSRERLVKLYQQSVADLQAANDLLGKAEKSKQKAKAAVPHLERLREEKEQTSSKLGDFEKLMLSNLNFEEGSARRRQLTSELAEASTLRTNLANEIALRTSRRKELPQLISEAQKKLQELQTSAATGAGDSQEPLVQDALKKSNTAAELRAQQNLHALLAELRLYESETQLLPLQVELAQRSETQLQEQVDTLNTALAKQRASRIADFRDQLQAAKLPADSPFDRLRSWLSMDAKAKADSQLDTDSINWFELAKKQDNVKSEIQRAQDELERWNDRRIKTESRIQPNSTVDRIPSSNQWAVARLRKQRDELPDADRMAGELSKYQDEMRLAESLQYDLGDVIDELTNIKSSTQDLSEKAKKGIELSLEALLAMKSDADEYLNELYLLADKKTQLISLSIDYRDFINKQLLWTPSAAFLKASDFVEAIAAGRWLMAPQNWQSVVSILVEDIANSPGWYVIFSVAFAFLVINQSRLRRKLSELSNKAKRNTCTDFSLSLRAAWLTGLIAAPVPVFLLFAAWRLNVACQFTLESGFPRALALACLWTTETFISMELLRQVCRSSGLGIMHFGWRSKPTLLLKRDLRWLIDFSIPLVILVLVLDYQPESRFEDSLGRLAFVLLMVLMLLFFARVFSPKHGVLSGFIADNRGGWLDQLKVLWYPSILALPLGLAALSISGYCYTALNLAFQADSTLCAAILLLLAYCLTKRWLLLNRRQLMMAQARQRLEAAAKKGAETETPALSTVQNELDLVELNTQTTRLVTSGFVAAAFIVTFFIWSDIIPAVQSLERFVLWKVPGDLPDETVSITLANLVLVVPILVLTVIVTRNVPGLLEIALLQHLPLTSAARYAITTLARYVLFGIGMIMISRTIGLRWANMQWLVAGLGVGLGFGLQEIFANFISGIVVLFEQPIRVGDIVTIDGTTGTVAKIRMRATTITNWDRQELIVPNKQLITGTLINWTLSDSTNRILLNVGVAYGTDTVRACEIVRQVCGEHPDVLKDPAPLVTFEGFGDNTLNLVVRAYLSSLDRRLATIHDLHERIYRAFAESKVEIAFPQRDLHIRSFPEPFASWLGKSVAGDRETNPSFPTTTSDHESHLNSPSLSK